jgi:2-amino-4-hydroxy-6-hydroxymethyldihydropteridine diphosphokinase
VLKKKTLDEKNTLLFTPHFPYNAYNVVSIRGSKKVLLGIGGNIGNVVRRFERLLAYLDRSSLVQVLETAPILKNPPFGYTEQGDFYNSLLLVETQLTAKMLLRYVLGVEKIFGRKRSFKDAPRTLDIDIIFYENVKMETQNLTLPHPGWKHRDSVLIPLSHLKGKVV